MEKEDIVKILKGDISVANYVKDKEMTRQWAYFTIAEHTKEVAETEEYKLLEEYSVLDKDTNVVVKLDNKDELSKKFNNKFGHELDEAKLDDALLVFEYQNKKHIFQSATGDIWLSKINVKDFNAIMTESFKNLKEVNAVTSFEENNIEAPLEFVSIYENEIVNTAKTIDIFDWLSSYMSQFEEPVDKEKIFTEAEKKGYKESKVKNALLTNYAHEFVNLSGKFALKEIFLERFVGAERSSKIVAAACKLCDDHKVCKTDAKWIYTNIQKEFPEKVDLSKLDAWGIKAILADSGLFQKGVKMNLTYLENECNIQPDSISELVEQILENQKKLPVSLRSIYNEVEKRGRSCSLTTLNSLILPEGDFVKIGYGWALKKYEKDIWNYYNSLNMYSKKQIVEYLKHKYKVSSVADLAEETGLSTSPLYQISCSRIIPQDDESIIGEIYTFVENKNGKTDADRVALQLEEGKMSAEDFQKELFSIYQVASIKELAETVGHNSIEKEMYRDALISDIASKNIDISLVRLDSFVNEN